MKQFYKFTLVFITLWGIFHHCQAQVLTSVAQAGTYYANPVIPYDAPDPTVMFDEKSGNYYLFGTGASLYRSKNLISWTRLSNPFATAPTFVPNGGIWALDANKIGNKYVLYFAMSVWGGIDECGIGIAYSSNPEGPYVFLPGTNGKMFYSYEIGVRNSIDPFYMEDNGKKYLFWGSFYGIYGIELSDDGLSIKEGAQKFQIAGTAYEGSYIHKRGDYYYYFGSTGSCCEGAKSTYQTVYGRSTKLEGPYVTKTGEKLLNNKHEILIKGNDQWAGTGHNSEFITDKNGDTWIMYHAYSKAEPEKGRQVLLDKVTWNSNGWPMVKNGTPSVESARPKL